jgi:hypothetical protein
MGINIDTPWTAAASVVNGLIDRFVPNPAEAAKEKADAQAQLSALALATLQASTAVDTAQAATNTAEAASSSKWNSGWRPYIGWVCGTALGMYYIPYCLVAVVVWAHEAWVSHTLPARPDLGITDLIALLAAMLGVSTQRMVERLNGKVPPGK